MREGEGERVREGEVGRETREGDESDGGRVTRVTEGEGERGRAGGREGGREGGR